MFQEQIEVFTEQLKCNEEKIEALEECKAALGAELETVTLTMNDVSEKWEVRIDAVNHTVTWYDRSHYVVVVKTSN